MVSVLLFISGGWGTKYPFKQLLCVFLALNLGTDNEGDGPRRWRCSGLYDVSAACRGLLSQDDAPVGGGLGVPWLVG